MASWRLKHPRTRLLDLPLNAHADDVSGYGSAGAWTGTEAYAAFLKGGQAGSFDGASYVTLDAAAEARLRFDSGLQDFSIVAWVRHTNFGAAEWVFDKRDGGGDGWAIYYADTNVARILLQGNIAESTLAVTDTAWHCIVGVVDRDTGFVVYLDGVPGTPTALAGPVMATTTAPRIGARSYDGGQVFDGDIARIRVYNIALTHDEVNAITHEAVPVLA